MTDNKHQIDGIEPKYYSLPTASQIIERSHRVKPLMVCGVYYLIQEDEIVYVGQSNNVMTRIAFHYSEGRKTFDRFSHIIVDRSIISDIEAIEIVKYQPKYNALLPDNDVYLTKRGLRRLFYMKGKVISTQWLVDNNIEPLFLFGSNYFYTMAIFDQKLVEYKDCNNDNII